MTVYQRIVFGLSIAVLAVMPVAGLPHAALGQQVDLNLRILNDLATLDPSQIATSWDYAVASVIYSGLVRTKPGTSEIVPDLAARWDISADGTVYTFMLRRGVRWHRGFGELTAADVKYSFDRIMDPATASRFRSDFELVQSVDAVDPYTVRITLRRPYPAFLSAVLAYRPGYIVNRRALEQFGRQYLFNAVGTGPYVFEQYVPGQGAVVAVNKEYYGPSPRVQRAMLRIIKEDSVAEIALEKGDIQLGYFQEAPVLARLVANRQLMTRVAPFPRVVFVFFNTQRAPFNDLLVRRALLHAVDKKAIVQSVFLAQARPAGSVLSPGMFGYVDEDRYPFDPDRAGQLLAEAGFPGGIRGKTFDLVVPTGSSVAPTAPILQRQWRRVGVDVKITLIEDALWQVRRRALQFDLIGDGALRTEPDQILASWFHSSQIPVPNAASYGGADALIDGAREQMDLRKRADFIIAAQRKIQADAPVLTLVNPNILLVWRPKIRGVEAAPLIYNLDNLSLGE